MGAEDHATSEGLLRGVYGIDDPREVGDYYDSWASSYDAELTENGYASPARVARALAALSSDRLARSVPDARDIGDTLARRGVVLSLGGRTHDPDDPMGKMFFIILATFAEFEVDLIRLRTREGMAVAKAQGKLKGRQPKLSPKQQRELQRMHATGEYTITDLGELFSVSRPTVYRTINRAGTE